MNARRYNLQARSGNNKQGSMTVVGRGIQALHVIKRNRRINQEAKEENARLKQLLADTMLDKEVLEVALRKKY